MAGKVAQAPTQLVSLEHLLFLHPSYTLNLHTAPTLDSSKRCGKCLTGSLFSIILAPPQIWPSWIIFGSKGNDRQDQESCSGRKWFILQLFTQSLEQLLPTVGKALLGKTAMSQATRELLLVRQYSCERSGPWRTDCWFKKQDYASVSRPLDVDRKLDLCFTLKEGNHVIYMLNL